MREWTLFYGAIFPSKVTLLTEKCNGESCVIGKLNYDTLINVNNFENLILLPAFPVL